MRMIAAILVLVASVLLPLPVEVGAPLGKQLLENRGCERPGSQGEIPGWVVEKGAWAPRSKKGGKHPGPKEGRCYFAPEGASKEAVLYQEVDLTRYASDIASGEIEIVLEGSVASYRQKGGDTSRVRLEFVNAAGDTEAGVKTQRIYSPTWKKVALVQLVPTDAKAVRVYLDAKRVKGSCRQHNNDGCFDDLSLKLRRERK